MKHLNLARVAVALCAGLYLLNTALSNGIYDASDGLAHYQIARYAPDHPELFLDHWGKPLFTTLAAPFAQFRIKGVIVFNIILFVFTSIFLIKLLRRFEVKFTWAAPLLLATMPVYYYVVMSGLTEVLFAAVSIAGLWAYSKEKFWLSALFITWLPFARSEAYFIVPLFGLAFLLRKQWLSILILGLAPFIMSVIGWFVFDDFLWIIHNNPYTGASDIYGHGEFMHFINNSNSIFGLGLTLLASIALIYFPFAYWEIQKLYNQVFLISLSGSILILLAHSYFWWKGLYGSFGLLRVMATTGPFVVTASLISYNQLASRFVRIRIPAFFLFSFCVINVFSLNTFQTIAKSPSEFEQMAQELRTWYRNSEYNGNPNVWFMHPLVGYNLEIDDREPRNSNELWDLNRVTPSNSVRENGLIIYDGAHSPNEGKTSKELLMADYNLKLVKSIDYSPVEGDPNVFQFRVFAKLTAPRDTLVFENFQSYRPLLEGRLDRIEKDSVTSTNYFNMLTWSAYMQVYKFWAVDTVVWNAPKYMFWYKANKELEVYLVADKNDGSTELIPWHDGNFSLPELKEDVISYSLDLRNPTSDNPVKVYEWGLVKLNSSNNAEQVID